jgi:SH3 domain-containing YSC84-like protein 1
MTMRYFLTFVLCLSFTAAALAAEGGEDARLQKASEVFSEIMKTPDGGVPKGVLEKAVCLVIIPSYKKAAFGIGGSAGKGAVVCRRGGNGPWGAPAMYELGGPSIGFQIGGSSSDIILAVMNASGAKKLLQSKVKLGADASAAIGPVGRTSEASTDAQLHAEMLTYSRSRGAFAGLSLDGAVLKQDGDANERLYGKKMDARDILFKGGVGVPAAARELDATLTHYSPHGGERVID